MASTTDRGLTSRVGPVEVNWPRTVGYYGGLALAVGFGMIEPPFGVFIAAVPFFKMLNRYAYSHKCSMAPLSLSAGMAIIRFGW